MKVNLMSNVFIETLRLTGSQITEDDWKNPQTFHPDDGSVVDW